jgi:hypothetical protein
MRTLDLSRQANVTLNGAGAGTVQLGPSIVNEQWSISQVSVSCSANVTTGTCECQIFAPTLANFKDGTFSGDTGDTSDALTGLTLWPGQYVYAVFTGGVPGAIAYVQLQGTRDVP